MFAFTTFVNTCLGLAFRIITLSRSLSGQEKFGHNLRTPGTRSRVHCIATGQQTMSQVHNPQYPCVDVRDVTIFNF